MLQTLVDIQRDIYAAVADYIKLFAGTGNWMALLAVLPMGVVFGEIHALTQAIARRYFSRIWQGRPRVWDGDCSLRSRTHVTMAVVIAVLSLPLVSIALGSIGRAPILEDVSRGLLGLIGLWMIWRAMRKPHAHHAHEGETVGVIAGLIPCPLTLFVMTLAIARGVPEAGIVFAVAMVVGVAATLSVVAVLSVVFNRQTARLTNLKPKLFGVRPFERH